MTISLKQKTPFYLMKMEQTPANETTGATNLMAARGLEHSYHKLTSKCKMTKSFLKKSSLYMNELLQQRK